METFKGKMLVRRKKTKDGKPCVILCGVFFPSESIENYDETDEMWAVELGVLDVKKFHQQVSMSSGPSPEEFLEGTLQNPEFWLPKP